MTFGRISLLVIALSAVCGPSLAAGAAKVDRSGSYDNVRYIEVADDYVGVRAEVRDGPRPTVDFEVCEGWCNGSEVFPATITGDRISFTYMQRSVDVDGRKSTESIAVTGRFVRRGLLLKIGEGDEELLPKARRRAP
jgi:hypothetical protein